VTVKIYKIIAKSILFQVNAVLHLKNPEKKNVPRFAQIIFSSTSVFTVDNNIISTKSIYHKGFWNIIWHWKV